MHVKIYCFRNWRCGPPWPQETTSNWSCAPEAPEAIKVVSKPLYSRGRQYATQDTDKENHPGHRTQLKEITGQWTKGCEGYRWTAAFIWLTSFLNSKSLTYTFFPLEFQTPYLPFLLIKRAGLKWNLRWSLRVYNLLSSQITGHLNKIPIKIQSLSLLIGSGGDRKHEWMPTFLVSHSGDSIPGQILGLPDKSGYLVGVPIDAWTGEPWGADLETP